MDQLSLALTSAVEKEVDGIQMGVLSDGTSYLTASGLARVCGVARSAVITQGKRWLDGNRDGRLAKLLLEAGIDRPSLYHDLGTAHAYPEDVCMVALEYYALEANPPNAQALNAYRKLARAGLRLFVYSALGYDPSSSVPLAWRHFHDRMTLVTAPIGYFSVFKETADFVIGAIRGGLPVDDHTIPDISVGVTWANRWRDDDLDERFGERRRHEHNYPDYYPQAASNPQEVWVYPVDALPEFRRWMQAEYIPDKLPAYLDSKVAKGVLPASTAEVLILSVTPPALADGDE